MKEIRGEKKLSNGRIIFKGKSGARGYVGKGRLEKGRIRIKRKSGKGMRDLTREKSEGDRRKGRVTLL